MFTLLLVFLGQCVFALVVIFILKKLLDKELMRAALESFDSCKTSSDIREITVRWATPISDEFKSHLEYIRKHKFAQANLNFQEDSTLKGGVIIVLGDCHLDFSLSNRLQNFWS